MSDARRDGPNQGMNDLEARFDAALGRAARALVTEELPRGILDRGLAERGTGVGSVTARRTLPGYAAAATIVILVLAMGFILLPGGGPGPSVQPSGPVSPSASGSIRPTKPASTPAAFRTMADIRADYLRLGYTCVAGRPLQTVGPGPDAPVREGLVCTAPDDGSPYMAAAIIGETADGRPVELHAKAGLLVADTPAARDEIAVPLAKAVAIVVPAAGVTSNTGDVLARWVLLQVPMLEPDGAASTDLFAYTIKIIRTSSGGYELFAVPTP